MDSTTIAKIKKLLEQKTIDEARIEDKEMELADKERLARVAKRELAELKLKRTTYQAIADEVGCKIDYVYNVKHRYG